MTNEVPESSGQSPDKQNADANKADKQSTTTESGRNSRYQFYEKELTRLQSGLEREKSKISKPTKKHFTPDTFSDLKPYFDTTIATKIIVAETEPRPAGFVIKKRDTATGLCDPWKDYQMDQLEPEPTDQVKENQPNSPRKEKQNKKAPETRRKKEGSTHLPKFPAVAMPTGELTKKSLTYNDVPTLREELKKKYSLNADSKTQGEYKRTKQDFYRMDLDRLDQYHPINRQHMRATYFAYLQNNPGSRRAVYECTREAEKQFEEEQAKEEQKPGEKEPEESNAVPEDKQDEPLAEGKPE